MKLQEAFDQCMQSKWKGTAGETTAQINGDCALEFFGDSPLKRINTRGLDQYVQWLTATKGNGPATVNRKLAALSGIMRHAFQRQELTSLPHFPYQREPQGRLRWLTEGEEADMLAAMEDLELWDHAICLEVLIDTGLRPSELWALKNEDVVAGALMIRKSKNGLVRCVPMTKRVTFHFENRVTADKQEHPFPYNNAWMNYGWNRAKEANGFSDDKEFVVYALRHTCASRLLQRNVALPVVQGWLGHTNPAQTMRYAHLSQANYQQAMTVLEKQP
jgi:integrase